MTLKELAKAYVALYDDIDGVTDELSEHEWQVVNEHYAMYLAAKELAQ